MTAIASCEVCDGPAWWCLDQAGAVWYLCQDESCVSNLQVELFPEEPIWDRGVGPPTSGGDAEEPPEPNRTNTDSPSEDCLPF